MDLVWTLEQITFKPLGTGSLSSFVNVQQALS